MDISPFAIALRLLDDDDVLFGRGRGGTRARFVRERHSHFDTLDDLEFERRFRLSKDSAVGVLQHISSKLEFHSERNDAVQPMNQLLLALRFYATGCTQMAAADFIGVSEPTACRIVHRVSHALAKLCRHHIYMPRDATEILTTQRKFASIARFPKVIGAVDVMHVKIRSPGGDYAEYFRNRKGYFSLKVQAICNADLEFTDVVARWPGSTHDQTIFDNSRVRSNIESGLFGDGLLLGDSSYSSRSYMMTPLKRPSNPAEELYNESQIRTRNSIERIFDLYKRTFPCVAVGFNVQLEKVQAIIIATSVLFNILRRARDPQPPNDPSLTLPQPWEELINNATANPPLLQSGRAPHRLLLINHYFGRLVQGANV